MLTNLYTLLQVVTEESIKNPNDQTLKNLHYQTERLYCDEAQKQVKSASVEVVNGKASIVIKMK